MSEATQVGDIVVVGVRPGGGQWFAWFPLQNEIRGITENQYQDYLDGGAASGVIGVETTAESAVDVFVKLLEVLKKIPGASADDLADLNRLINEIEEASAAYKISGIRDDYEGAVEDALKFFYEEAGDILIGYVTGTLLGTAFAAGSFELGPGAIVVGVSALAIGAGMSAIWPADELAELTAGAIFGTADAIDQLERGFGSSIQDSLYQMYRDFQGWIFRNAPGQPSASIDASSPDVVSGTLVNGVTEFSGTVRLDNISFAAISGAVAIDMAISGAQSAGAAGVVSLLTIDGVAGSQFNDTLLGNERGNVLSGNGGDDFIDGRTGFDFADYSQSAAAVTVNLTLSAQNTIGAGVDTLINIEGIRGSGFDDVLVGDGQANTIYGGSGSDSISGAGGDDILFANGGLGNGAELNVIDGGDGVDMVSYEGETRGLVIRIDDLYGFGGSQKFADNFYSGFDTLLNIEDVTGGSGSDHIVGNASSNRLLGGAGDDWLLGAEGDDFIEGGEGFDRMDGGAGFDFLSYLTAGTGVLVNFEQMDATWWYAGGETYVNFEGIVGSLFDDTLVGNFADNAIYGNDGSDVIDGKAGDDTIVGGEGLDTMTGGAGADRFVFQDAASSINAAPDVILDFEDGIDSIDVSGFWTGGSGAAFTVRGNSTYLDIDIDGDGLADFSVEFRGVTSGVGIDDLFGVSNPQSSQPSVDEGWFL